MAVSKIKATEPKWHHTETQTSQTFDVYAGTAGFFEFTFTVPSGAYDIEPVVDSPYCTVSASITATSGNSRTVEVNYVGSRRSFYGAINVKLRYHL